MEASQADKNIYGPDVKLHPVTKMPLEQGHGALPADIQAHFHCDYIEHHHGKHVADAMREKLSAQTVMQKADANLIAAEHEEDHGSGSI